MKIIQNKRIRLYIAKLWLVGVVLLSGNANARVELVELNYEDNKIKLVVESRSPISFEYFTNEQTRKFGVLLEGDDFYPALTDYFQSIDIDKLSQCIDDITIVPISNNAARLEVKLAEGFVASAYDDTANSPRNFRVIIQYVALDNNSPCFPAGESITTPQTPPPAVVTEQLETMRPFNASEFDQVESIAKGENMDAPQSNQSTRSKGFNTRNFSAYLLYDVLSFTNKGGLAGDDWLKQAASSELRAAEVALTGRYSDWEYQLALQSMNNSKHEQTVSLYRASFGYVAANLGMKFSAGVLAEPFGGEVSNSLDRLPFLERSLTAYLANEYNPGATVRFGNVEEFNVELGVFGKRPTSSEPSSNQSMTVRALYTPYRIGDSVLTLGYSYRLWEPIDNIFSISARPESNLIEPLFSVLQAEVDSVTTSGLNMFMIVDSFTLSIESITSTLQFVSTVPAGSVKEVSARSIWGSWFITGERRHINNGELQRVNPLRKFELGGNGWGAFETGIRLSQISDSDNQKLSATSLGVVWHLNNSMQFKATWAFAVHSSNTNIVDNDADIVEIRIQLQY